jgi:4-hydroxybutyrate dehydrogenase
MGLISYLTTIHFDFGAIAVLGDELKRLAIRRPLVVTDRGVIAAGLYGRVAEHLPASRVFDATPPNPTEASARTATAQFRAEGCDGIIAIGGGSSIDLAKAVALLATHPEPLQAYAAVADGAERIGPDVAPIVAVPTTAGTGSEVGRVTVIVMDNGRKLAVLSPHLIPASAICDPDLTIGLPPPLTAGTGMDAIAHCVEALLSPRVNPPADAIALDGLARAVRHIERVVRDGADRAARWEMMMASLEGGLVFQKGLGAVHAMSHPLGALREPLLHHGTLNAVLLPTVLRFNADYVGEKYDRIRAALALPAAADLAGFFEALNARLRLPPNLAAMGVHADILPTLARMAAQDFSSRTNPRPAVADDYLRLYRQALSG